MTYFFFQSFVKISQVNRDLQTHGHRHRQQASWRSHKTRRRI